MNNVLQLKGTFQHRKNSSKPGPPSLPKGTSVQAEHLATLLEQLERIEVFWKENSFINGALVSVYYKRVIAKSNRVSFLLNNGSQKPNETICGSKFIWETDKQGEELQKHVFTHFISMKSLSETISKVKSALKIVSVEYKGEISSQNIEDINNGKYKIQGMSKSAFAGVIVDTYYVERFGIESNKTPFDGDAIITLYRTGVDTVKLLDSFGIDMINAKALDETTIRLSKNEIEILQEKAPYLISMGVTDISKISFNDILEDIPLSSNGIITIPSPKNEPIIGVIDTYFDESVYFNEWVEYIDMVDPSIEKRPKDYEHGTAVTSIIVDGPSTNPELDDGCGRFRVRHFGVAGEGRFSSFTILKMIRNIVAENRDIKVWNLSLGSTKEIALNFMSPEGAELDKIQTEYDVIFVVAGTNKDDFEKEPMRIGAPADSLNSIVVNSVDFLNNPADYSRVGPVLSFFYKPDVSYYGGSGTDAISVCKPLGQAYVQGTSYAAPWITRKVAYLIYIMGLNREVAKALLIDSAAGWKRKDDGTHKIGYGVVPKRIEDILYTPDDEIRFVMTGTIDEYETYTFNIPVPRNKDKHPFVAKATLAYFPKCVRNQGVDYTSTEMDIHFGRITLKDGKPIIKSIDCNRQSEENVPLYEEAARKMYRKWDNIKHINEPLKANGRAKKAYESGLWGISIKTKERLAEKSGQGLQFGIVVTLKEINGVNRIDEFMKLCAVRGWIVHELDIHNQIDVYLKAEEEIEFD